MFGFLSDDKWVDAGGVDATRSMGPVRHIGDHEVRKVLFNSAVDTAYELGYSYYVCWRCEERYRSASEFDDVPCHDCNCEFCPKEKS